MQIFHSILKIDCVILEEYVAADSPEEAKQKHLKWIDEDVYDYEITSEQINRVDSIPETWRSKSPNEYGVYRG